MGDLVRRLFASQRPVARPLPELVVLPGAQRLSLPKQTRHLVCNPSILKAPDGSFLCMVRGVNYNIDIGRGRFYGSAAAQRPDSQSYLMRLSADLVLQEVVFIEDRHIRAEEAALDGIEDFRLLQWRGAVWVVGTARNETADTNVMVLARLQGHLLVDPVFLPSPHGKRIEKNWTPLVVGETLYFIYSHDPLQVFMQTEGRLEPVARSGHAALARCSGGSGALALPEGGWRSVIHRYESVKDRRWRIYEHMIADYAPDFTLRRISRPFRFELDGVEFCAGLARDAGGHLLSYGVRDNTAVVLRVSDQDIEDLF